MKKIAFISAFALAVSSSFAAAPAMAQEAPTDTETTTPAPTTCFGSLCDGGSISINAIGRSGSAGQFEAWFGGGENVTGEANATEMGGSYSVVDIGYSTCNSDECSNFVSGSVGAYKIGETTAWAYSQTPGESAMAGNIAESLAIAQFAASVCTDASTCGEPSGE